MIYKRRITTLYLTATSLRSYLELNWTGFRKILKKYDKTLESPVSAFISDESLSPPVLITVSVARALPPPDGRTHVSIHDRDQRATIGSD